jgi:hypothetical protein
MTSADLLYDYRWPIGIALIGLFLLSRYIMRRVNERRESRRRLAAESGDMQLVTPDGYRRARKQFLLALALLVVIVAVSVLTHLS